MENPLDGDVKEDLFAPLGWAHGRCSECMTQLTAFDCMRCDGHLRAHCRYCGYACMTLCCRVACCRNHVHPGQHACTAPVWIPGREEHQIHQGESLQCEACGENSTTPTCPAPCRFCFGCQEEGVLCICPNRPRWFPLPLVGAA